MSLHIFILYVHIFILYVHVFILYVHVLITELSWWTVRIMLRPKIIPKSSLKLKMTSSQGIKIKKMALI